MRLMKAFNILYKSCFKFDYNIDLPGYVPEGYKFIGMYMRNTASRMSPVQLLFGNNQNDDYITIDQKPVTKPSSFIHNFRNNDAGVKQVDINGYQAVLVYFKNNDTRQLMWQSPAIYFMTSGPITEEDIINLGSSMQN